ncbi:acyltransferase, partial [Escherichia coli]|nr:acyltransferase [Escherichia coli]
DIQQNRANGLDGMRFYLASFVILHHMDCSYSYFTTGEWTPISQWLLTMGKYGVALFFMTTAYLFWGKIRNKKNIDWVTLYQKRFLRIVPLAFFCSFMGISILFIFTEKTTLTLTTISNILSWFDGSLWDNKPPVTTFQTPFIVLAGVTWTLKWEWMFYFSLPLLFILNKKPMELTIILFAFSFYLLPSFTNTAYLWSYFFAGMLCRELKERIILSKTNANYILIAAILLTFLSAPTLYSPPETAFLAVIFFCIISGAEL